VGKGDTNATFLFCRGGVCGGFCLAGLDVEFFFRFGFCVGHVGVGMGGERGWVRLGWVGYGWWYWKLLLLWVSLLLVERVEGMVVDVNLTGADPCGVPGG